MFSSTYSLMGFECFPNSAPVALNVLPCFHDHVFFYICLSISSFQSFESNPHRLFQHLDCHAFGQACQQEDHAGLQEDHAGHQGNESCHEGHEDHEGSKVHWPIHEDQGGEGCQEGSGHEEGIQASGGIPARLCPAPLGHQVCQSNMQELGVASQD